MALSVDIEKRLGDFTLKVAFEAGDGVTALMGASGSGKSMTCRCISGIERPDRGRIALDGRVLYDSRERICLPPQKRHVGYLFQQYALFPTMTVWQNLACAVRDRTARDAAVAQMLARVQLQGFDKRYPHQLSGGQQQRVALARMLLNAPDILLLDEPFSSLDSHLRFQLQNETRQIIREFGRTVLLVSHDRDEVYRLADAVAILREGRIESCGEKHAVFADPGSLEAARLTGCKNISRLRRLDASHAIAEDWGLTLPTPALPEGITHVGIRMHNILPGGGEGAVRCRVVEETETPFTYIIALTPEGVSGRSLFHMELPRENWLRIRALQLDVVLPLQKLLWLRAQEER